MLPIQQAYSAQVKKKQRNELFDLLKKIPEAKRIHEWNIARQSKDKESKFVPDPLPLLPSRPVIPSMHFNPFKFKQGRRREPKDNNQGTKKKVKGRAQPLGLHDQQICKYHHPSIYPPTYPGDEPVMAITVDLFP